jgi:hypothetical protein
MLLGAERLLTSRSPSGGAKPFALPLRTLDGHQFPAAP